MRTTRAIRPVLLWAFLTLVTLIAPATPTAEIGIAHAQGATGFSRISRAELRRRTQRCPAEIVDILLESAGEADETMLYRSDGFVIRMVSYAGSGVDGSTDWFYAMLHVETCTLHELQEVMSNNALYATSWSGEDGARPAVELIRLALRASVSVLDATRPEHALAALISDPSWVSRRAEPPEMRICSLVEESSPTVVPLTIAEQPWHSGRPRAAPSVYVPETGELVRRTLRPRRALRGDGFEIYTVPLPSRYQATAIAVYLPREGRHRWLFITRECVLGAVRWLGQAGDGWVLGLASGSHSAFPTSLFGMHVSSGAVRLIGLEELTYDGVPERVALCRSAASRSCVGIDLDGDVLEVRRCSPTACTRRRYPLEPLLAAPEPPR